MEGLTREDYENLRGNETIRKEHFEFDPTYLIWVVDYWIDYGIASQTKSIVNFNTALSAKLFPYSYYGTFTDAHRF